MNELTRNTGGYRVVLNLGLKVSFAFWLILARILIGLYVFLWFAVKYGDGTMQFVTLEKIFLFGASVAAVCAVGALALTFTADAHSTRQMTGVAAIAVGTSVMYLVLAAFVAYGPHHAAGLTFIAVCGLAVFARIPDF